MNHGYLQIPSQAVDFLWRIVGVCHFDGYPTWLMLSHPRVLTQESVGHGLAAVGKLSLANHSRLTLVDNGWSWFKVVLWMFLEPQPKRVWKSSWTMSFVRTSDPGPQTSGHNSGRPLLFENEQTLRHASHTCVVGPQKQHSETGKNKPCWLRIQAWS